MFGAAMALSRPEILNSLSGRLVFMAVPAEEYIEIEYRDNLRRQGKIEFLGGKPELVKLGEFRRRRHGNDGAHHVQSGRKAALHQRDQQRHYCQAHPISSAAALTPGARHTWE